MQGHDESSDVNPVQIDSIRWELDFATTQVSRKCLGRGALGYGPAQIEDGEAWWDERLYEPDRPRLGALLHEAISKGATDLPLQYRFRGQDGTFAWVADRVTLTYEGYTPTRSSGCIVDLRIEHGEMTKGSGT